jgi:raffinose/stachyose/melibiose transport system permease protein
MWMWNDFLLPLLIVSGHRDSLTLEIAACGFFDQFNTDWNFALAGALLSIAPAVAFFLALQKHIVKGMIAGAVKG